VNVVIGRNNSGKSHLIDLVEKLCGEVPYQKGIDYRCRGALDEQSLRPRGTPKTGQSWTPENRPV